MLYMDTCFIPGLCEHSVMGAAGRLIHLKQYFLRPLSGLGLGQVRPAAEYIVLPPLTCIACPVMSLDAGPPCPISFRAVPGPIATPKTARPSVLGARP
jgi:hypothetical protein